MEALTEDAAQDEMIYKGTRTSKRQKKLPKIKSDDFKVIDSEMSSSN